MEREEACEDTSDAELKRMGCALRDASVWAARQVCLYACTCAGSLTSASARTLELEEGDDRVAVAVHDLEVGAVLDEQAEELAEALLGGDVCGGVLGRVLGADGAAQLEEHAGASEGERDAPHRNR